MSNLARVVVGLVLASRRHGNRIGWLLLVPGLALQLSFSHAGLLSGDLTVTSHCQF
jgi:hypothetical protein